jgi:GMP synthase (glutamine-hydrolysing)
MDFGDMFVGYLKRDFDTWVSINVAKGDEIPDIEQFQGIVITGSHYNVSDGPSLPWFLSLCEIIRRASENGKPNIYGGCFGAQVIGHALEGSVGCNPSGRFILKAETLVLLPDFFTILDSDCFISREQTSDDSESGSDCQLKTTASPAASLRIIESHGMSVLTLPPDATLLASSATCPHEIFVTGSSRNILACQAHPEFDYQYCIEDRIWPSVVETKKKLTDEEAVSARQSFEGFSREDSDLLMNLISTFLRR